MSKAFGEQNPTLGETAVSWQTFTNGSAVIPDVVGDVDWGKLKLDLLGQEGRSAVYDLGAAATRKFTLTENRYGTGAESATIQIRGDTSAFVQDDVLPAWETYTAPVSKGYRYVQVRATTVVLGWWLSGGISAANCIAAYQPKGAATYAASKINLANPGTYNAVDGAAYPTWDGTNGWKFDAASSQYLTTGMPFPSDCTTSSIIRITNCLDTASNMYIYGGRIGGNIHGIQPTIADAFITYHNSYYTGTNKTPPAPTSCVLCMAGAYAYRDGVEEGITLVEGAQPTTPITAIAIGADAYDSGGIIYEDYYTGYIQAISFYNTVLSQGQVTALVTAMNLL
jgi:hypothetical protein